MRRLPALGRAGGARRSGGETARASLAAKRLSVTYDAARAGEVDLIAALEAGGLRRGADRGRQAGSRRRAAEISAAARGGGGLCRHEHHADLDRRVVGRGERHGPGAGDAFRWVSALIALPTVAYAGQPFFVSALGALKGRRLNMDVPISLAILLATGMSLYQTMLGSEQVYFDAAVSLLFFLLVGRFLDEIAARARPRRGAEICSACKAASRPSSRPGGARRQVPAHALRPGDRLLVATGERVAADGVVAREGTGRSEPDHRRDGAATVHRARDLCRHAQPEPAARDRGHAADSATLLAEISRLMLAAEQGKARYRRLADRAAAIYAPAVHGLGLATFLGWLLAGASWQTALTYAIAVLIITCPCALALAVPAVQIAAASRLFRRRIMVKTADGLERIADTDMVVFDKTGTLTFGRPELIDDDGFPTLRWRLPPGSPPQAASLRARNRRRGGAAAGAGGAGSGVEEVPGAVSSACHAQGEERLGSAEWCWGRQRGEGQRGLVSPRLDGAGPLPLRRRLGATRARWSRALKRQGYGSPSFPATARSWSKGSRAKPASRPGAPS